jgi:hypothetical protein
MIISIAAGVYGARDAQTSSRNPGIAEHQVRRVVSYLSGAMSHRRGLKRRRATGPAKPHRNFDPRRVGELECDAWVAYYRREWIRFLRSAVGLTRQTFGLPWPATIRGAVLVLRANQLWAPVPDNDPDGARRAMERFYRMVAEHYRESYDAARAAELEVEWWRIHREHQHDASGGDDRPLVDALSALYAYVYGVPEADVRVAAQQRAIAMDHSDRWVQAGCDPSSPLIGQEQAALVRSYAALLAGVHR